MAAIVLIYPPYSFPRKYPPLGLAYIASLLEKAGYPVCILDMSPTGMDWEALKKELARIKPHIVGISFMTNQYRAAIMASKVVKQANPNTPVIVGGPHVSALPQETLSEDTIDFVVMREGETTMLELVPALLNNATVFDGIAGIAYKKAQASKITITAPREYVKDLDSIPFPAWHLLPIEQYSIFASGGDARKKMLSILSSRGCPNQCIFCDSHTIFGRKFRGRSAENIFEEIVFLKKTYDISQFDFADDTITIDKRRITKLCNLILENDLKINWMCNARVNTVDFDMLTVMKKAGCVRVDFGVESANENVLRIIKKRITPDQIRCAHKLAQLVGIKTSSFLMVGNIGDDFDTVKKTVQFAKEFVEDINVSIATPFPGTELYQIAKKNLWLREKDWSRYVTAPTYLVGYHPVMITEKMNEKEIMKAFFYVHSKFAGRKFRARYGKWFYLNPFFYSDKLFEIGSWKDCIYKMKLLWSLFSNGTREAGVVPFLKQ